jgi:hypothetical protein
MGLRMEKWIEENFKIFVLILLGLMVFVNYLIFTALLQIVDKLFELAGVLGAR